MTTLTREQIDEQYEAWLDSKVDSQFFKECYGFARSAWHAGYDLALRGLEQRGAAGNTSAHESTVAGSTPVQSAPLHFNTADVPTAEHLHGNGVEAVKFSAVQPSHYYDMSGISEGGSTNRPEPAPAEPNAAGQEGHAQALNPRVMPPTAASLEDSARPAAPASLLNATNEQKAAAFEWLRSVALGDNEFHAALLLHELASSPSQGAPAAPRDSEIVGKPAAGGDSTAHPDNTPTPLTDGAEFEVEGSYPGSIVKCTTSSFARTLECVAALMAEALSIPFVNPKHADTVGKALAAWSKLQK